MMLCDVILNYRAAHGLSQRQFAALSGLSHAFISMIETQNNPATKKDIAPSVESLRRLAQAMGMTLHELMQEIDDQPVYDVEAVPVDDEAVLLSLFRSMSEKDRAVILATAEALAK